MVNLIAVEVSQNPLKAGHVTWWPSLKRLSGMQVQYLFEWGNIKFSKTVRQAYDYISYLKSPMKSDNNCIINVVYFAQIMFIFQARPTSAACAVLSAHLRTLTVSIATGTSNSSCSGAMTLAIGSFTQKAGLHLIEWPYWVLHCSSFKTIWVIRLGYL